MARSCCLSMACWAIILLYTRASPFENDELAKRSSSDTFSRSRSTTILSSSRSCVRLLIFSWPTSSTLRC